MAILRSVDGNFYEVPDDQLSKFAVPADQVKEKLQQAGGPQQRGPQGQGGAVIASVDPSSGAAGLFARGDVILAVNGVPVNSVDEVTKRFASARTGSLVVVKVWREGAEQAVPIRKR